MRLTLNTIDLDVINYLCLYVFLIDPDVITDVSVMDSDLMINVSVNDSDVIIDSDVMTKYVCN